MDNGIKLIVHSGNLIFDAVIVAPDFAIRYEQNVTKKETKKENNNAAGDGAGKAKRLNVVSLNAKGYNAYLVSAYIAMLMQSSVYRRIALVKLSEFLNSQFSDRINIQGILINLHMPRKQVLDYKWNGRISEMVLQRREVDHAMSWLSTLGGAFSSLGDQFQHCAEMAGQISVKQFKLALRLGDPLIVARCKLYAALSLIQQEQFELPGRIIRNIYKFAISEGDVRLQNMCLGIWAKLRYCYNQKRKLIKSS